jgi:NAD+ diphosphatase
MSPANPFAGAYLDRRAEARLREDWLAEALADPETRYILMHDSAALVRTAPTDALTRAVFLPSDDPRVLAHLDPQRLVLLGWFTGYRCVLVELDPAAATVLPGEAFAELRPLASELPAPEAALLAYARALNIWRANHRHCGRCGARTIAIRAGHARLCTACDHETFPRIDPAIIVLVHDGQRALLGRQATWPPNRYSTIAGFVEPGETLEEAVRREVGEETGIRIQTVDYHSSQPWPFPASLMLGFQARGEYAVPTLHDGELEDARWFTSTELRAGTVLLPPRETISRRLIDSWLDTVA